ncbi:Vacuolar transporter chaperone 4 OS=Schizosaccharomyces pombe (strain 972 / ATCC 24843) GN=vtc4 PE=1 SV=2 [Rhizoctonia solani AG-1 IB]|uniref:Vacuolar transporter chaperone complex subunit 4 n=2 Tax=Thanatephorus cucumeris (strain AG1-IB / isolate 7/3/14) TaxID=1108050 RepID=A0A0B7FFZ2_THACB|nr:Vacuolar transporter chaperone 4 OS=Schizosaccharomyces pombe (strain 972 / ATCC 24843) GN=vtc4 PE=1 SV=2 [Rhizoctonia solani AG-1 IB]
MKFGQKIKNDSYAEWRAYYLDYTGLKKVLKAKTSEGEWTSDDEDKFVAKLEAELEKIHQFQMTKARLLNCFLIAEHSVKTLVEQQDEQDEEEQRDVEDGRAPIQPDRADDAGSDDELDDVLDDDEDDIDALEENFRQLEEEVATIVADVHDLALYTKLNFTGFVKIVKKHDKQTGLTLKRTFAHDYLEKRPFYKYNWDSIIVKLSKLYDLVRTRGHPIQGDSSAGGAQNAFVRQTTKYWVHPDNMVHLKLAILRHLPVLVFNPNKEFEPSDSAITSIYFDNEDLELYLGRLEKTEGAEAVRLRWYGDMSSRTIFVERKTHREDWTGEKSVKERFPIKEDKVNAFLRGEYTMDEEFRALAKKGKKTEQEIEGMIQLASEVQYAILTRKLVPVMRSFYNRTAFQLPGDARVRISLDTELTMVREDNWDGEVRSGDNWRRPDAGIDFPFPNVPERDKEIFKYGVLEVKLQTQLGQEPPQWVRDLVSSHLVESVPKFSKFIHGCATLLPNRVDLVPFWLPQMEADIRKPDTGNVAIGRPISAATSPESHTPASEADQVLRYTEPVSEGEEDEMRDYGVARDEVGIARLDTNAAAEVIKQRQAEFERQKLEEMQKGKQSTSGGRLTSAPEPELADDEDDERTPFLRRRRSSQPSERPKGLSINPLAPSKAFDKNFKSALNKRGGDIPEGDEQEDEAVAEREETEYVRHFIAQPGKKIAVPVRVEPKVYFANERTFLKWLQFAVMIGTVATTLLNFSKPGDNVAFYSAICFTFASLLAIAYAGVIFVIRALKLRTREVSEWYYDRYGPTVLSVVLLASIAANLGMRIAEDGL